MTASAEPTSAARSQGGRAPDFFIVGHPKSGTTALYEMLKRHPQIYMPASKEPLFFASDMRARFQPRNEASPPRTLDDYLALFADAGPEQRVGEASSSYLWSSTAAAAIARVQPDARIVAILREPASFLRSMHLQLLQAHVEVEQDFRRAMSLEEERRRGRHIPRRSYRPQLLQYSEHVRYVEQLRRYDAAFPRENMLVLIYDDFLGDNTATVQSVLRFLDVDDSRPIEIVNVNPTIRVRSHQLDDLVHSLSVGRGPLSRVAKGVVKLIAPGSMPRKLLQVTQRHVVHGDPRPPDEEFMLDLRRRFKPEVVALGEYLDRDLETLWGYRDVD